MGLYERLTGESGPKIHVHTFCAMLQEYRRGGVTQGQINTAFSLSAGEQTEAGSLLARIGMLPPEFISLGGAATLTNIGASYDATSMPKGLGFVDIDMTDISSIVLTVRMNRNAAAGTVSWQLWNETDAAQVGVIDDTTGAGDKFVQTTISGLTLSGVKRLRLRAKSTTSTDDPIYYGSNLRLVTSRLRLRELEDVLIVAEEKIAPYGSVNAVKTRLGV